MICAQRRMGEMLAKRDMNKGGRPTETPDSVSAVSVPTLEELGISEKQSSRWQQLASIDEEQLDEHYTQQEIAVMLGAPRSTVEGWLVDINNVESNNANTPAPKRDHRVQVPKSEHIEAVKASGEQLTIAREFNSANCRVEPAIGWLDLWGNGTSRTTRTEHPDNDVRLVVTLGSDIASPPASETGSSVLPVYGDM